jgi:PilZ domain
MREAPFPQRREFSRVAVNLRTEVTAQGTTHRDGTMENLSLKGGFFRTALAPAEGEACDIRLHLDGTDVEVHALGTVVRRGPAGCAIQFTEIVGIDSLEHLRNIILFNALDPTQVEREFQEHLGLRRGT